MFNKLKLKLKFTDHVMFIVCYKCVSFVIIPCTSTGAVNLVEKSLTNFN